MTYDSRLPAYQKIEESRGCPLISFVTSTRPGQGAGGQMAADVIPEFTKQIIRIPKDIKNVDILIVSHGGDPTVSWRVISILRERFSRISVIIPYAAFSAATLLALGADEILMHPFANLGPVDPQLTYTKPGQPGQPSERIEFGSEDVKHFIEFVRQDVGISDQMQLEKAFELICHDTGGIPIGIARRSSFLALTMGEKLLSLHMKDQNKAKAIAEALNTSFYHHGYPLSRREAKEIGLPVHDPDQELENLIWDVWTDIETEMECNTPFNPLDIVMADGQVAQLLDPVPQWQVAANLPPQLLQQAYQQYLQQAPIVAVPSVDYELFNATLESSRCRSEFRTKVKINAIRRPDMSIAVNVIPLSRGYVFEE